MVAIVKAVVRAARPFRRSAHAGEILRDLYLEPLGVSITQAAQALGVTLIIVFIKVASRPQYLR